MSRGRTAVVVEMVEVRRARREAEHSAGSHGPGGRRGNAKGGEERGLRVVVARWWLAGLRRRESRRGGEEEARGARRGVGRAGESETLLEPRERPCCFGGLVVWGPCPCCFGLTFPRSIYVHFFFSNTHESCGGRVVYFPHVNTQKEDVLTYVLPRLSTARFHS